LYTIKGFALVVQKRIESGTALARIGVLAGPEVLHYIKKHINALRCATIHEKPSLGQI
jgi:hypothetical protein